MFQVKQAKSMENIQVLIQDSVLAPPGEFGTKLAAVYTSGENQGECLKNIQKVIPELMILSDGCPWLES